MIFAGLNWLLTNEEICTPHHLGRFPNPDNKCQFFECAMNFKTLVNCSKTNQATENILDYDITKHVRTINFIFFVFKNGRTRYFLHVLFSDADCRRRTAEE